MNVLEQVEMGITQKSLDRLSKYTESGISMLELGAQNMYDNLNYGRIAKHYFVSKGIKHTSIDIIQHQECEELDLRIDWMEHGYINAFDVITNFGTTEHIDGSLYQPLLNIHNAGKERAFMVNENPKTGNWPEHGQHYFTKEFWSALADACIYEVHELTEEPAMSNEVDGWNVCCVLRKSPDSNFITEERFNEIYNQHIKSK